MQKRGGRWTAVIVSVLVIGGLCGCGWRWWDVRRYKSAMAGIDEAIGHGRYATAARELSTLLDWRPGSDRATYLRGVCEKALGQPGKADATWAAIPPDSIYSGRAIAGRAELLIEQGRFADTEDFIMRTTDPLGLEGSARRMILIPNFVQEGRAAEAQRLIESRWQSLDANGEVTVEQAVNLARLHMEMRWNVPPGETLRTYLDQVGRLAPGDDRIWLARANLAIRASSYDEARRWIEDCLRRRPDDRAVWQARLDWSMRTNRLAEARVALKHVPAELATPTEVHRLSAWIASVCGDLDRERHELAAVVAEVPEDFATLERLEKLEQQESGNTVAAKPRRPRAEIERDQMRYRELYRRNQPARDAEEMARLAERLGHRFEAILFLTAAIAEQPDRADLRENVRRLMEGDHKPEAKSQSLFDSLPWDCGWDEPSAAAPVGQARFGYRSERHWHSSRTWPSLIPLA
jgi:tetratricopeptide (TPR) repeat protein